MQTGGPQNAAQATQYMQQLATEPPRDGQHDGPERDEPGHRDGHVGAVSRPAASLPAWYQRGRRHRTRHGRYGNVGGASPPCGQQEAVAPRQEAASAAGKGSWTRSSKWARTYGSRGWQPGVGGNGRRREEPHRPDRRRWRRRWRRGAILLLPAPAPVRAVSVPEVPNHGCQQDIPGRGRADPAVPQPAGNAGRAGRRPGDRPTSWRSTRSSIWSSRGRSCRPR